MPAAVGKQKISYRISGMSQRDVKERKKKSSPSSTTSRLRPILATELTEDIPLEKFYVGKLRDKRNTSKAIRLISVAAPGFGYLKRCSGYRLLLTPVMNITIKELKDHLTRREFDLSLLEDEIEVLEIPSKPSRTKRQAEICGKLWPINFHPDQTIESIISGDIFSDEKLSQMELLMRSTIDATRIESIGNSECNGSALIVDPDTGQPVALAASKLDEHPLRHASILAIDLVAKIQGGGAWDLTKVEKINRVKYRTKRKLDQVIPLCYPPSLIDVNFPDSEPLDESSIKLRQKNNEENFSTGNNSSLKNEIKTGPYLCTNFWVFLVKEPCALCAMALIHSRASKIFYGVGTSSGVLGSKALLHTTPGLNHRYQVWSGILENECKAVCEEIKTRELPD